LSKSSNRGCRTRLGHIAVLIPGGLRSPRSCCDAVPGRSIHARPRRPALRERNKSGLRYDQSGTRVTARVFLPERIRQLFCVGAWLILRKTTRCVRGPQFRVRQSRWRAASVG
jgi:hypothetical protein